MTTTSSVVDRLTKVRPAHMSGHKGRINTTKWSIDGSYLASGSSDDTVKVFQVEPNGVTRETTEFRDAATKSVTQVCWSSSGNQVAACSQDKDVRIWDVDSNRCAYSISTRGDNINIAWSPNGNYIVTGNRSDILSLIDIRMKSTVSESKFDYEVNEIAFTQNGEYLFTACGKDGNGKVNVLKLDGNNIALKFDLFAHTANCYCVQIDKSEKYLATGGADALVTLFSLQDMVCIRTFPDNQYPMRTIGFSHDSAIIAYASEDSVIEFSDVETGELLSEMETMGVTNSLDWHPKMHILAYAGDDKQRGDSVLRVVGVDFT